jgi:predicted RNA binding protein YcfA (HicA-like mRNA interferase family)
MNKQVTFQQVERFLLDLGFVPVPTSGDHKVFDHQTSGARVVLPPRGPEDVVEPGRIAAIRNVLVGKGVLDGAAPEELFDALLEKV